MTRLEYADPITYEGACAAREGVPGYSCPYPEGTEEADQWHEGWESYWRPDSHRVREEEVEGRVHQIRHGWERGVDRKRKGDNCGY